jgi:ribosome-associated toxin RatA of RatAB toxin-antitoxin module
MLIKKEAIILKDIKTVFNIVNNVNSYKNFVPYCIDSDVLIDKSDVIEAKLDFNLKGFKVSFTTSNKINKYKYIKMTLVDGPFKYLDGVWDFKEVNGKTVIYLTINYEAKNKIVEYTIGKSLEKITKYLIEAFVKESKK